MLRGLSLRFWGRRWLGFLSRRRRSGFVLRWRRLLRARLWLNLLLALRRRSWGRLVLRWWRRLLRMSLRLNLLLALRRRLLLLTRWWCLLRVRLWLNLLLALRRRRLLLTRWWCLLRVHLWLNLLLALRRSRSWLVLRWRNGLLRTSLRLNLLLARGRRCYRSRCRLVGRRLIAIRLNILLGRGRLTGTVELLWLHGIGCGRWRGARSRSRARWNYCGDGFALRDRLGCGNDGGLAVIDGGELLAILRGLFAMLNLSGHRGNTLFAGGS